MWKTSFRFRLVNFTDSLKRISVEFKFGDTQRILDKFVFEINDKETDICIPLEKMKSNALKHIVEICFVVHPADVNENEGMFSVENVRIS